VVSIPLQGWGFSREKVAAIDSIRRKKFIFSIPGA
jgi:hypothetical protein